MRETNYLVLGRHNVICDRCGFKLKDNQVRKEWTGLYVCSSCYEPRHPQDFLKGVKDDPSVPFTRPESADTEIDTSGWVDTTTVIPSGDNDGSL